MLLKILIHEQSLAIFLFNKKFTALLFTLFKRTSQKKQTNEKTHFYWNSLIQKDAWAMTSSE